MKKLKFMIVKMWKECPGLFILTILQNILKAVMPLINIIGLGYVVDVLVSGHSIATITRVILLFLLVYVSISIVESILSYLQFVYTRKASNQMQSQYAEDSLRINYHHVQDGKLINLKRKSMNAHPSIYINPLANTFCHIIQLLGIISIVFHLSPIFISVIALFSTISFLLTFKRRSIDYQFRNEKISTDRKLEYLFSLMSEYRYAKEVRLNQADSFIYNKSQLIASEHLSLLKQYLSRIFHIENISGVITVSQSVIMYLYFTYQVVASSITIAEYTVLLGTTALMTSTFLQFIGDVAKLKTTCNDIDSYQEYTALMQQESTVSESDNLPKVDIDFSNLSIEFKNVSFTYPGTNTPVLNNLNFVIDSKQRIALIGLNGSGKTTIVKLLTRLYEPDKGSIKFNGIDIQSIPYSQYISKLGVVLQDFFIFSYSIKENITFGKVCEESTVMHYLYKAGLKEKLLSINNDINTPLYRQLDDKGYEFSGGESQKLALARALFINPYILILDEPSSAIDPMAEFQLFSQLNHLSDGKNTLFITHRLSSTRFCDKILVLENGSITGYGTHEELMNSHPFYAELYNTQSNYYKESGVTAI